MNNIESNPSIQAFDTLRSLVGLWKDMNSTAIVEYRESAHGSILVETWTWPEKKMEALTVYFLDSNTLFATHYCPLGNQPTLQFSPNPNKNRFDFHTVSTTNLPDKNKDHCVSFWTELISNNEFTRSESYAECEKLDTMQSTYQRT